MNLYKRFKPKHKQELNDHGKRYPHTVASIIAELKSIDYFTEVKYGTAYDILTICKLEFFGDAFDDR